MTLRRNALVATAWLIAGCSGAVETPDDGTGSDQPVPGAVDEMGNPIPGAVDELGNPIGAPGAVDEMGNPVVAPGDPTNPADPNNPGDPAAPGDPANPADPGTTPAGDPACTAAVTATSQLPRLTSRQYDNTIAELLGITNGPSSMLAPDSPGSVDQRAWDGYRTAAEALAAEVVASPELKAGVLPCTPAGDDDTACASQFVADFGLHAFRRPLTPEETARFEGLFTSRAEYTQNGTFDEALQLMIEAFLVSPSFLMRTELSETPAGDYIALNGYEIASRLSYLLWGSMPDDELFNAAAAGTLSTPAEIMLQAQRMLLDTKARGQVAAFHEFYAHMGPGTRWAEVSRDTAVFPQFNDTVAASLSAETTRLFEHVVFDQAGGFRDLLLTPTAFVNASTAPLYGLDGASYGQDMTPVDLDPAVRPGVFTRLGFLASFASFSRTSPILRGAYLQKEILCTEIPAPPPGVEGTPLPADPNLITNRQKVDAQTADTECAACHHGIINPTGFAMESFNAVGVVQTTDNGAAVDTIATVPIGGASVEVSGPADLMAAIADSPAAQRCYAAKWVRYANQREMTASDACVADALGAKLADGNYTVLSLVADLTQTDSFRYRAIDTEVAQ